MSHGEREGDEVRQDADFGRASRAPGILGDGREDVAVFLRVGSTSESDSGFPRDRADLRDLN